MLNCIHQHKNIWWQLRSGAGSQACKIPQQGSGPAQEQRKAKQSNGRQAICSAGSRITHLSKTELRDRALSSSLTPRLTPTHSPFAQSPPLSPLSPHPSYAPFQPANPFLGLPFRIKAYRDLHLQEKLFSFLTVSSAAQWLLGVRVDSHSPDPITGSLPGPCIHRLL